MLPRSCNLVNYLSSLINFLPASWYSFCPTVISAIGRNLIPRYFRSIFEGGVKELYYHVVQPKESYHNNTSTVTLDCDNTTMVTHHNKPVFTKVGTTFALPVLFVSPSIFCFFSSFLFAAFLSLLLPLIFFYFLSPIFFFLSPVFMNVKVNNSLKACLL